MRMLDYLLIFFLASITATFAGEIEKKISSRIFSGEPVDLGSTYDFLTNDNISYSFIVLLIAQYIFSVVGLIISHLVWSMARGDSVSSDPGIASLQDFLLSDQTAANNVALGFSYAIAGSLAWIFLSQLGSPSTTTSRSEAGLDNSVDI